MKQSFQTLLLILLFSGIVHSAVAQDVIFAANKSPQNLHKPDAVHSLSNKAANNKVTTSFNRLFPAAEQAEWFSNEEICMVNFVKNGRKTKAVFDLNGKLNYSVTSCSAEKLPRHLQLHIQKQYSGYTLFNNIEIHAYEAIVYQVILENKEGYITLRSTDDNIEESNTIKKL